MLQCCTAVRNLSAQVDFLCPFFDAASTTLSFSRNFVATNNIFQYGQTMYHPLWLYGFRGITRQNHRCEPSWQHRGYATSCCISRNGVDQTRMGQTNLRLSPQ